MKFFLPSIKINFRIQVISKASSWPTTSKTSSWKSCLQMSPHTTKVVGSIPGQWPYFSCSPFVCVWVLCQGSPTASVNCEATVVLFQKINPSSVRMANHLLHLRGNMSSGNRTYWCLCVDLRLTRSKLQLPLCLCVCLIPRLFVTALMEECCSWRRPSS